MSVLNSVRYASVTRTSHPQTFTRKIEAYVRTDPSYILSTSTVLDGIPTNSAEHPPNYWTPYTLLIVSPTIKSLRCTDGTPNPTYWTSFTVLYTLYSSYCTDVLHSGESDNILKISKFYSKFYQCNLHALCAIKLTKDALLPKTPYLLTAFSEDSNCRRPLWAYAYYFSVNQYLSNEKSS